MQSTFLSTRVVFLLIALLTTAQSIAQKAAKPKLGANNTIYIQAGQGTIYSMDSQNTTLSSVLIANGVITAINQPAPKGVKTITLQTGEAAFPGFIDSHSHAISFGVALSTNAKGQPNWINLSSVNVMQQPLCTSGPSTLTCFTPIQTQAQVNSLIQGATPNSAGWILGYNYDPSRLICANPPTNATFGYNCPNNFANQSQSTVAQQLDNLRSDAPIFITSESGHISYANTKGMQLINVCAPGKTKSCYLPTQNVLVEEQLAQTGQFDEDVALHAMGVVEKQLLASSAISHLDKSRAGASAAKFTIIKEAQNMYTALGYTTIQEGAADTVMAGLWSAADVAGYVHTNVALLIHLDGQTPSTVGKDIAFAKAYRDLSPLQNVFVAGIKFFADGSNQGYTGYMGNGMNYQDYPVPFAGSAIFTQPYNGLPDYTATQLNTVVQQTHAANFAAWIHTNGTSAQADTIQAFTQQSKPGIRDVAIHFTTPTQPQVNQLASLGTAGATFLMNDLYYYYQPLCEQMIEQQAAVANLYPAHWAATAHLHFGLHSDTSVTPPSPLFSQWIAVNRMVQQAWQPALTPPCSTAVSTPSAPQSNLPQAISPLEAMRAYTSDAAWLYNRDTPGKHPALGSLQAPIKSGSYAGDVVILSADPLQQDANYSTITVLYTIHNGEVVYQQGGPIPTPTWPQ